MTYPPRQGPPGPRYPGQRGPAFPGPQFPHQQQFPPPQQFPGYPPGPRKSKKGLVIGLSLAVVILLAGAFAITAWIAPGFLLNKRAKVATVPDNPEEAKATAVKFVDAVRAGDAQGANATVCASAQVGQLVQGMIAKAADLQVTGVSGTSTVTVELSGKYDGGKPAQATVLLTHPSDGRPGYCLSTMTSAMML
ncbi:hypothetical protein [Amycolatopsis sp. CA-230715]|uniref:hypothetical protein n=1 Tax=Amycolatopsis sp. CA-230715 TaxID=2745196 RepID=UPI001C03A0BC|nr:hypothetical protein [Amycolatopsis sp. CA-230715]QWF80861.1 hypothetical protein HUW46_04286 [Amycolatopsis sp. CA-230715]